MSVIVHGKSGLDIMQYENFMGIFTEFSLEEVTIFSNLLYLILKLILFYIS